ncbi:MAG: hypothetical protein GX491_14855 [Chloroflexi bacterium]|nr:hypothetical protein [Chloroflexota bacterium]
MENRTRSNVAGGILLILLGLAFLSYQLAPGLWSWLDLEFSWPLIVVGVGLFFLIAALISGEAGLAVPACVIGGIGFLLYWQNATGNWGSWAYAWALIPGFAGVGTILMGLISGQRVGAAIEGGIWAIVVSLVIFSIFSAMFGGINLFGPYWPVLLILLGLILIVRNFLRR